MNKKGFTLIELLAIVIILGVIMVVAAPSITKQIDRSEKETQSVLNQKIENAAHLYAAKYHADEIVNGGSFSFTLSDLENDGLLDLKGKCSEVLSEKITYNGSKDDYSSKYDYSNISNGCYKDKIVYFNDGMKLKM